MGRNLYILAGALAFFAAVSVVLSFTNISQQPGSPGDAALWRTTGIVLFLVACVVALAANLSELFAQAERRAERDRRLFEASFETGQNADVQADPSAPSTPTDEL